MSPTRRNGRRSTQQPEQEPEVESSLPAQLQEHTGLTLGQLATGLAILGIGLMVWNYLEPDLRRYIKISSM